MSEPRVHIVYTTAEELRAKRADILREHPKLAEVDPSEFCCGGCVEHDIAAVYGYEAQAAWVELQNIDFLLEDS